MQLSKRGNGPLLSVGDRWRPMLRACQGHGWRGRPCSKPTGDGHQLDRRVSLVQGDYLPPWQASRREAAVKGSIPLRG